GRIKNTNRYPHRQNSPENTIWDLRDKTKASSLKYIKRRSLKLRVTTLIAAQSGDHLSAYPTICLPNNGGKPVEPTKSFSPQLLGEFHSLQILFSTNQQFSEI